MLWVNMYAPCLHITTKATHFQYCRLPLCGDERQAVAACRSARVPFYSASGRDPAIRILLDMSTLSSIPLKEDRIDPRLRKMTSKIAESGELSCTIPPVASSPCSNCSSPVFNYQKHLKGYSAILSHKLSGKDDRHSLWR